MHQKLAQSSQMERMMECQTPEWMAGRRPQRTPNAGVDGWPKAPVDVEPNAGVDGWPKAPVDVVPKGEPPVCAPNVVVGLPNGFGANGLEVEVLAWPNPVWAPKGLLEVWPKGLVDDCPNAARNKHIISH
jgi:hypothetical protein